MSKILGQLCPSQALSQEETNQEGTDTDKMQWRQGLKLSPQHTLEEQQLVGFYI